MYPFTCFQGVESVKKEIGDLGHTGPYRPPTRLRKRSEFSSKGAGDDSKVFEANEYVSAPCVTLTLGGGMPLEFDVSLAAHAHDQLQIIEMSESYPSR